MTAGGKIDERLIAVEELFDREIRPLLASHLGGANIRGIDDAGTLDIEFTGACTSCAFRRNTIVGSIYPRVRELAGVNSVSTPGVPITLRQQQRVAEIYDDYEAKRQDDENTPHRDCHTD